MLKGEAEEEYVVQDSAIRALKAFLDKQAVGPVANTLELTSLLAHCWDKFEGCAGTEMHAGWKLRRGIEDAVDDADARMLNR